MGIYNETLSKILASVHTFETEKITLIHSINRVLAEDIIADIAMPPFHKAAVDGFACRLKDICNLLEIIDFIPAGKSTQTIINKNQCVRIMTGASIPEGADTVFMLEDSELIGDKYVLCNNPNTKRNICYKGEDFKKGDLLIPKGFLIKPVHIGIMASVGYHHVLVSKIPKIGLLATGNEIIEPYEKPAFAQIRNSTAWLLMGLLQSSNIKYEYAGIAPDDFNLLLSKVDKLLLNCDVLILTGGASIGDCDLSREVFKKLGFEILVEHTGLQPGNPMIFGKNNNKYCFGLSGNPVSSLVQFELLLLPFLYRCMGYIQPLKWQEAFLINDYERKKGDRLAILPVKLHSDNRVEIITFHGSAHLNAWTHANALLKVPETVTRLEKNEKVYVRPI